MRHLTLHAGRGVRRLSIMALLPVLAVASAWAQDKGRTDNLPELRLSTAQGPAFPLGKAAERWAALINEPAGRAFDVKVFPGATLAGRDPTREFGILKDGPADLAVGSALAWSAQFPAAGVYALPWLAPERHQQEALVASAALLDLVVKRAAMAEVVVLAVAPAGDRVLATIKAPVRTPADASGLRVRVPGVALTIDTYAALSAQPLALDFAAAQAAFAAGTLDGQDALRLGPAIPYRAARGHALGCICRRDDLRRAAPGMEWLDRGAARARAHCRAGCGKRGADRGARGCGAGRPGEAGRHRGKAGTCAACRISRGGAECLDQVDTGHWSRTCGGGGGSGRRGARPGDARGIVPRQRPGGGTLAGTCGGISTTRSAMSHDCHSSLPAPASTARAAAAPGGRTA
jgi:Bacterial extracellular solute-binding protein, family 7